MNVLILAAGLGTRLRPLTDAVPKPLVLVGDRVLLDHQLAAAEALRPSRVFANAHHLAEQVVLAAESRPIDHVFVEPEILGTGGPLHRLREAGYGDDLLVVNGDVLHDVDLTAFVAAAQASDAAFALVVADNPAVNSVGIDAARRVVSVDRVYEAGASVSKATFSGIAWYRADALARIAADDFSIVTFWRREAEAGRLPLAWQHDGIWIDVGTPAGLHAATFHCVAAVGGESAPRNVIYENATLATDVDLDACIVMPGAVVPSGRWRRTIFLPGDAEPWIL